MFLALLQIAFSFTTTYDLQGHGYQIYQTHNKNPLIVLLHGCNQDATSFYKLTKGRERSVKATIIYINQNPLFNSANCWNWFYDYNQRVISGTELDIIYQKILYLKKLYNSTTVHIVGFSSGAGMASSLAFNYSKTFNSALIHSGPGFGLAKSSSQAETLIKTGTLNVDHLKAISQTNKNLHSVVLVQGRSDIRLHPNNQHILAEQFSFFLNIDTQLDQRKRLQEFTNGKNSLIVIRLPIAHQWAGGDIDSNYSAPDEMDILDYYYSSVVGI